MTKKNHKRILVTSALPYANGPIHIGHLVEYIQTDIYVRFLKLIGEDAIYCCADDTHGAPIQINAAKQGISPEELIAKYFEEHTKDFRDCQINFDSYYSTNSEDNRKLADHFFEMANKKGLIYTKDVELTYCEKDKRFLPDRFVKGTCPKCQAEDQYGDVCEKCNSAYNTTDLINPKCIICGSKPTKKFSKHYFFKLSAMSDKLEKWLKENNNLQDEVKNFVFNWINEGLKDWDISRDGPYFGFNIPGEADKYYYVWLDAPIGYIASTLNYSRLHNLDFEKDYWKSKDCDIIHFIGKDIIYFHFLFWPALLMTAEFNLPKSMAVHGFLTVNGEKMSKSRGTFYTAKDFLQKYDAAYLRYYFASNLSRKLADIDLSFKDFNDRVNNELVANIANFTYRVLSLLNNVFDSKIGEELDLEIIKNAKVNCEGIKESYSNLDFREAVKKILQVSSIGNKYLQDNAPWKLAKESNGGLEKAHLIVSSAANIAKDLIILIKPIMPNFAKELELQFGFSDMQWTDLDKNIKNHKVNSASIIIKKIEEEKEEGKVKKESLDTKGVKKMENATKENKEISKSEIATESKLGFGNLNVKIGEVLSVENHPNADRLYVIKINLGTEKRQIVGGLKAHYTPEELVGKKLCIVTNLERNKLRGIESEAMLLAGSDDEKVGVLFAEKSNPGDQVYVDGIVPDASGKEVSFKDFQTIEMKVFSSKPFFDGKNFKTDKEEIKVERVKDGAKVR